jgi:lipoprotein-anchoring transpeptidase ErfK/SrfK
MTSKILRSLVVTSTVAIAVAALPRLAFAGNVVAFSDQAAPGTIIIKTTERKLYFVLDHETAIRYPIAIPRRGREWSGSATVIGKLVHPDWAPPPPVRADHPDLPELVPSGSPGNPVGARAIMLDRLGVAIHGTSTKTRRTIGTAASYGCIRMLNEDVIDLFDRVRIGTPVLMVP